MTRTLKLSVALVAVGLVAQISCGSQGGAVAGLHCNESSVRKLPVLANNISCAACTWGGKSGYLLCYEYIPER